MIKRLAGHAISAAMISLLVHVLWNRVVVDSLGGRELGVGTSLGVGFALELAQTLWNGELR